MPRLVIALLILASSNSFAAPITIGPGTAPADIEGLGKDDVVATLEKSKASVINSQQLTAITVLLEKHAKDLTRDQLEKSRAALTDIIKKAQDRAKKPTTSADEAEQLRDTTVPALEKVGDTLYEKIGGLLAKEGGLDGKGAVDEVTNKLTDLKYDQQVQALAAQLDNKILGHYLRTKLEGLSRSKEFCSAIENCKTPEKDRKATDMKGLFQGKGTHGETVAPK